MKTSTKFIFVLAVIFIVMLGGAAAVSKYAPEHNPFLKGNDYFTIVGDSYKEKTDKDSDGREHTRYLYNLSGVDKDGKKQDLEFTANKVLRKDAYLAVTIKADVVTHWEEVQASDIPSAAKPLLAAK
ncbi:YxeA family protein [Paenibacillus terrigena]|uniref:YxeA family protein n=1 Tax=Paenibacillus terrigena TaxID=369333 RepID=UPI00038175E9|nr:YxeA family protein [Paenibacillus terrigena]